MKSFIFTGFSPNTRAEDAWLAFKLLLTLPKQLFLHNATRKLEQWFREYFSCSYAIAFDSGRSALQKALEVNDIGHNDEVILQAFTCIVVANAVTNLGATPIYADCTDTYTLNPADVKKKITQKTKAIIIQHTFGIPAQLEELLAIARERKLLVIEDCAHSLGNVHQGKLLGTFGDLAMFSFGTDKVISGVRGGMIITNNKKCGDLLQKIRDDLPQLSILVQLQHLLHPIFFFIGKNIYHLFIGKVILFLGQKFRIVNRIIYSAEKEGRVPVWFPAQMPNVLATLAFNQIKNLDAWNMARQKNSAFYAKQLLNKIGVQINDNQGAWLRFPLEVTNPIQLKHKALKSRIILGDWYSSPVAPIDSSSESAKYMAGSCPNAERISKHIINLPTDQFLSEEDLQRVTALF
ncbi:MAG: hypothetical protein A2821_04025 [Candidatus Magasanikbacteria bacterium RIFCSPHIGHO2_01_FULL_41_23]|uniref:DegT/DnrJ/EryC1/StrS aminotransferase n=1 Tax=Candidatus Magasanikbacteria bacterium RIFCSPLOWO2_01_FULL_40_15 TaxID=1798686 RepID=A0A1F6N2X5_9BACT|nr:MAG: hypothetical protein A2821_04025 [Candidatus Magasanikbacteria bacterium RIFCSPHIGHO2_01_FULL_41_23]OGH66984.1 MAG: hypothetical protein A3C66_00565 [Candidatus Magasanikbacteria bacterium RIFCSPHIGHO2_02_FULL_41_35]OGH74965.1 MAG: hypothetical protein A3F22_02700 [Candidatus Magasanikbacteria bacterium RIFCSPHIGHO2_12_FULL_41_16]OGH78267.1 MAG: hypothetical protein A2983_02335 [Candidatus Magasanikbacteria bacterium RIFCSPLOWO2_01_FULL_40_15]